MVSRPSEGNDAAKADGTLVTVKLDKSFAVTAVEDGMGKGGPRAGNTSSSA